MKVTTRKVPKQGISSICFGFFDDDVATDLDEREDQSDRWQEAMEEVEGLVSLVCLLLGTSHETSSAENKSRDVTLSHRTERVETHGYAGERAQTVDARLGDLFFGDLGNGDGRKGEEAGNGKAKGKSPSKKEEKATSVEWCDGQNQHRDEAERCDSPSFGNAQGSADLDPQRRGDGRGELTDCQGQSELVIGGNAELIRKCEGRGKYVGE